MIDPNRHQELLQSIAEGLTANELAALFEVDAETIRKFARRRNLSIQRQNQSMESHPSWTGGTTTDRDGYILQRVDRCGPYGYLIRAGRPEDKRGYALQHRIVAHDMLGRPLHPNEVVHHIDGNVQNNAPDNLSVFSTNAEHLKATITGQVPVWTEDGIARMRAAVSGPKNWTPEGLARLRQNRLTPDGLARLRAPRPNTRGERNWRAAKRDHPKNDGHP